MGAYRSKPITDKVSSDELGKYVKCGASSMQGWRVTQEDAHNCILEYDENASLFAVYDGHGGHEVAQYCSENLPQYLKDCASYKNGDYVKALKEAFLGFDSTLVDPKVVKILKQIVKSADDELDGSENQNSGSEDEENIRNLYEEAQMPLEELMAKYQSDGLSPALKKLKRGTPLSPHLTAKKSSKLKSSEEACSSKAGGSNSSCGVVPSEESSCESGEKEDEKSSNEETDSTESVSNGDTEEKATEKCVESNGEQKSKVRSESNGEKSTQESKDSKNKTPEKSERSNNLEKGKDHEEGKLEVKSESVKEEASNDVLKENVKSKSENEQKEAADQKKSPTKSVKEEKIGNQKEIKDNTDQDKKDISVKVEVNGDLEPKEMLKESKKPPHENGDVADEETEEDEGNEQDEEKKSRKGKGKAIVKKIELPKRTSVRQRNMAILFHSLLLAQDSADSESDDEGDESFEGAEESSSNEEEEKEEAEAEGEDDEEEEEEEEEDEGDEEGEEEEEDDYEAGGEEDATKLSKGPGVESGCTAVVALLHGRDLYVANAGDSRCIVSRSGEALDMSLDHKPEDDIEMERIVSAGGFVSCDGRVNGGLNLSRAIGDHAYKQTEHFPPEEQMITALPDVRTISLDPKTDEFIVLACDGIWNSMTSQEVINFVRTRLQNGDKKLSAICEELFDFCLAPNTASDGTGCDNMTAVIVQFLPIISEVSSSDLPNTSINTAPSKRPASPSDENSDSSAKRFKTGVV